MLNNLRSCSSLHVCDVLASLFVITLLLAVCGPKMPFLLCVCVCVCVFVVVVILRHIAINTTHETRTPQKE